MRILALSLSLSLAVIHLTALEPSAEDLAKDLHRAANRAEQLWTCLQLEAWAERQDPQVRLSSVLRTSANKIYGDALLALPHRIHNSWDLGERLVVLCNARVHVLAPDGRPLQLPASLPFWPDAYHLSDDGRYLGIGRLDGNRTKKTARMAVVDVQKGQVIARAIQELAPQPDPELWDNSRGLRMADDGSAIVMGVSRNDGSQPRMLVADFASPVQVHPNMHRFETVGRKAAYIVCSPIGSNDPHLLQGSDLKGRISQQWEESGGLLLFRRDDALTMLSDGGDPQPMPIACPLGRDWRCEQYGRWLVVDTGPIDGWSDEGDFMQTPSDSAGGSMRELCLFAWSDLQRDPAAQPRFRFSGSRLARARAEAQALLVWNGARLSIRDIHGSQPVDRELAILPAGIDRAESDHHHYRVHLNDGSTAILDAAGRELWHGTGARIDVHNRRFALIDDGEQAEPRYRVLHLHRDPAQRKEVAPQIPAGGWWIELDARGRFGVARKGQQAWHSFDLHTGAVTRTVVADAEGVLSDRGPRAAGDDDCLGRFYKADNDAPRFARKVDGHEQEAAQGRWHLEDAFVEARGKALLLQHGGELWTQAAPDKAPELVGVVPGGESIRTDSKGRGLWVAARDGQLLQAVLGGPKLGPPPEPAQKGPIFDKLGWRVDQRQARFTFPGRGRERRWLSDELGFQPHTCQEVSKTQLLLVTDSCALLMDTALLTRFSVETD